MSFGQHHHHHHPHKSPRGPIQVTGESDGDTVRITPLGSGNEVGRSCHLIQYKGKTVLLDAGIHPAYNGIAGLPFFDNVDLAAVDLCLVTHFHLDHAASLPYLMEKTLFRGRVFMTHPTKAIYKWLLSDYVKVSNTSVDDMFYDEHDLARSYLRIEPIDYHQQVSVDGIRFTAYNAGHVLGAAMFLLEIAGVKILYTGDYSREEDRHLMAAERPPGITPDILICESTYGVQNHEPRLERESRFTSQVRDIILRGGRCLMPVFALGRAQELLLILDEYWAAHPDLQHVPIYYASSLAKKCMAVYQTYINMMNARIRRQFAISNPFIFKFISNLKNMDNFEDVGPCVMMASPGMLQNGVSRELLERWCTDRRNGLLITGYSVDGTLAKHILSEPSEITAMDGHSLPLRMSIDYISFSAHVDFAQNAQFIEDVNAPHLILVHGDGNAMARLKSALLSRYADRDQPIDIHTPRNEETIELHFRGQQTAKVLGSLAANPPASAETIDAVILSKGFLYNIVHPHDLSDLTDLPTSRMLQSLTIPFRSHPSLLALHLRQMWGALTEGDTVKDAASTTRAFSLLDLIHLTWSSKGSGSVLLEWEGDPTNDTIADAVMAVILSIESSPASVKLTHSPCHHHHPSHPQPEANTTLEDKTHIMRSTLSKRYANVTHATPPHLASSHPDQSSPTLQVQLDGTTAYVHMKDYSVTSEDNAFRAQVQDAVNLISRSIEPIPSL